MSDNKPDYAGFMRPSSSLEPSKSSRDTEALSYRGPRLREEEIPWAEIIVEPEDEIGYSVDSDFTSRISLFSANPTFGAAPPIAVLVVAALVVFFFLFQ